LNLNYPITITNANGSIFSGGVGGGGGTYYDAVNSLSCGGSGGGGQGYGTSLGASIGTCFSGAAYPKGGAGNNGSQSGFGAGGPGASKCANYCTDSAAGGNGGGWGENGVTAANSVRRDSPATLFNPGKLGGAAGKAIVTNGNAVTWISGNDATHLKGPVQ
jgi:hypothetical protein